jgi:histidyl-tRNA synthetase
MEAEGVEIPTATDVDVYVVGLGETTNMETLKLTQAARNAGFVSERDYLNRKAKAQFKSANKMNAKVVLTIGEDELANKIVRVKDMAKKEEVEISLSEMYADFGQIIGKIIAG